MIKEYVRVTATWEVPTSYSRGKRWWERENTKVWDKLFNDKGYCTSIKVQEINPASKGRFDFLKRIFI